MSKASTLLPVILTLLMFIILFWTMCTPRQSDEELTKAWLENKYHTEFIAYESKIIRDSPIPYDYVSAVCCAPAAYPDFIFRTTMSSTQKSGVTFWDSLEKGILNHHAAQSCTELIGDSFEQFYVTAECAVKDDIPMPETENFTFPSYLEEAGNHPVVSICLYLTINSDALGIQSSFAEYRCLCDMLTQMADLTQANLELWLEFDPEELYQRRETWYTGHHLPEFSMPNADYYPGRDTSKRKIPKQNIRLYYNRKSHLLTAEQNSTEPYTLDDYAAERNKPFQS